MTCDVLQGALNSNFVAKPCRVGVARGSETGGTARENWTLGEESLSEYGFMPSAVRVMALTEAIVGLDDVAVGWG
jgi:hypothetical protein